MLDPAAVIIREARPISLVAMFLIVSKLHAIHGWDAFLEVFGNPSIFAELPPGTSVEDAARMTELVRRLVSDGRGTVPSGTKFTTVETGQNNCAAFMERARWCKEAIITVACGGQLTVLAESGSGTLAGNAHADSFESLCAGTAASISAAINKQFTRRLLAEKWPDSPALAKFTLAPEPADERADMADLLGKLTAAGYALESDEAASELAHLPLRRLSTPQPGMPGMGSGMPAITNAARATTAPAEEPALTPAELAAFESLRTPNLARMEQHRRELETAMRQAADLPAADEEEGSEEGEDIENKKSVPSKCGKDTPLSCSVHGSKLCSPRDWKPIMQPDPVSPAAARQKLNEGIKVRNPLGEDITLDSRILEHWDGAGKTKEDIDNRLSLLPLIEEVVQHPAEIWENDNGSHTYLASYINMSEGGKKYTVAFTRMQDHTVIETYYANERVTSNKRKGKLLYSQN